MFWQESSWSRTCKSLRSLCEQVASLCRDSWKLDALPCSLSSAWNLPDTSLSFLGKSQTEPQSILDLMSLHMLSGSDGYTPVDSPKLYSPSNQRAAYQGRSETQASVQHANHAANAAAAAMQVSVCKPLQSKLLKQINALGTKEELLAFVERCYHLLDVINLVTCLYRLARNYSNLQPLEQRLQWKAELLNNTAFPILLRCIHSYMVQGAQAHAGGQRETHGLNARCLSNLIWSLVKLDVTGDDSNPLVREVITSASPLVLVLLPDCSGQGLANLLWSYAKIPSAPASVMIAIVGRMVQLLQEPSSSNMLDAQALSNSIWAIAHVRSRNNNELERTLEWHEAVTSFLLYMAHQCLSLLTRVMGNAQACRTQPKVVDADLTFSCQALVNIVWSFSSILGSACGVQDPISTLFLLIRRLAVAKLRSMLGGLQLDQPWVYSLSGSFNEQALSNLVYSYEQAQLLDSELMQAVLDCATHRLLRQSSYCNANHVTCGPLGFKPQELLTVMRACRLGLAQHQSFLSALTHVLAQQPGATAGWSTTEVSELSRQLQLLSNGAAEPQAMGVQQQQPQRQQKVLTPQSSLNIATMMPRAPSFEQQRTSDMSSVAIHPLTALSAADGYRSLASGLGNTNGSLNTPSLVAVQPQTLQQQPSTVLLNAMQPRPREMMIFGNGLGNGQGIQVAPTQPATYNIQNIQNLQNLQNMQNLQQVWVCISDGHIQQTALLLPAEQRILTNQDISGLIARMHTSDSEL